MSVAMEVEVFPADGVIVCGGNANWRRSAREVNGQEEELVERPAGCLFLLERDDAWDWLAGPEPIVDREFATAIHLSDDSVLLLGGG